KKTKIDIKMNNDNNECYETVSWLNKQALIHFKDINKKINLILMENRILFYDGKLNLINNYKKLLRILKLTKSKLYIEWLQKITGRYTYYNVSHIIKQINKSYINLDLLQIDNKR